MAKLKSVKETHVRERLGTPTDLKAEATRDVSAALAGLLADVFALYVKTKNFHWHMSGPHFRDYHLLLEEHGDAKLTDLLQTLADCPKARSASIHDRCKVVYEGLIAG